MKTLTTSFILLLASSQLHAWPSWAKWGAGESKEEQQAKMQNIVSALKEKFSSLREKRPASIAALEERVQGEGESYYGSLGKRVANIPCGTSRGYILSDGLSLMSGLQKIILSEVPRDRQLSAATAMAKYDKMIKKIRQDADPSFLSPQEGDGVSFINFLARFGEVLWDGKIIRQTSDANRFRLHNKIFSSSSGIEKFQANVYHLDKAKSTVNIDYAPSHYQIIRNIRDEIRQVSEHLYLGKAFYKGTNSDHERLILYFALDFSASPRCETHQEKVVNWMLPKNYQAFSACGKRDILWNHISSSQYKNLPSWDEVDAFGLLSQTLTGTLKKKMEYVSDVSPKGWNKPIHSQGSIAQVKFNVAKGASHPYTGLFAESSSCALLRLSLTGNPHQKAMLGTGKKRGVAPGLALKIFINGQVSQDISLLTSLTGQGDNFNFFAHEFSNQVAAVRTPEMAAVHHAFKTVSTYPERLSVSGASEWKPNGKKVAAAKAPSKIVFVPAYQGLGERESGGDIRAKFHSTPVGSTLFQVFAEVDPYYDEGAQAEQRHYIGEIVTVSPFVSSQFGDERVFFKHRRFEQDHRRKSH